MGITATASSATTATTTRSTTNFIGTTAITATAFSATTRTTTDTLPVSSASVAATDDSHDDGGISNANRNAGTPDAYANTDAVTSCSYIPTTTAAAAAV